MVLSINCSFYISFFFNVSLDLNNKYINFFPPHHNLFICFCYEAILMFIKSLMTVALTNFSAKTSNITVSHLWYTF